MNSLASSVLSCATTSATAFLLRDMTSSPSCSRSQRLTCVTELGLSSPVRAMALSVSSALNRSSISEACAARVRSTRTPLSLMRASRHQIRCSVSSGSHSSSMWKIVRSATTSCRLYSQNCVQRSGSAAGSLKLPSFFGTQNRRMRSRPALSLAASCGRHSAALHCPSESGRPQLAASTMASRHCSGGAQSPYTRVNTPRSKLAFHATLMYSGSQSISRNSVSSSPRVKSTSFTSPSSIA